MRAKFTPLTWEQAPAAYDVLGFICSRAGISPPRLYAYPGRLVSVRAVRLDGGSGIGLSHTALGLSNNLVTALMARQLGQMQPARKAGCAADEAAARILGSVELLLLLDAEVQALDAQFWWAPALRIFNGEPRSRPWLPAMAANELLWVYGQQDAQRQQQNEALKRSAQPSI